MHRLLSPGLFLATISAGTFFSVMATRNLITSYISSAPKNQADRHLLAFSRDNHRTFGPFEKAVIGQSQPVFGHEKSVPGIQYLVILVISHY